MKTLRVGMICVALTLFVGAPALAQTGPDPTECRICSGGTAMGYLVHNPKYDRAAVLDPVCPQTSSQT